MLHVESMKLDVGRSMLNLGSAIVGRPYRMFVAAVWLLDAEYGILDAGGSHA